MGEEHRVKIDWHRGLAVAAAGGITALALAAPAHATEPMEITTAHSDDGCTLTISAAGELRVSSQTVTAGLVVQVPGEAPQVHRGELPAEDGLHPFAASVTVGPFDADTVVQWRIFGGPVREDDSPAWNTADHPDWAQFTEDNKAGEHWDAADVGPFVTWHSAEVDGCPAPDPDPTTGPEPTTEPTKPAAPGKGDDAGKGGGDDQGADELPLTGASLPILLAGGLGLAMAGGLAWLVGRRKRVSFTA